MSSIRVGSAVTMTVLACMLGGCAADEQGAEGEATASDEQAIYYGDPAAANLAVVELYRNGGSWCTGFFISRRHIVTAAHCTDSYYANQWYRVRVKTGYTTFANITDSGSGSWLLLSETAHPSWKFNAQTAGADIAILTLPTTAFVPASQPKHLLATTSPFVGEYLSIWGWGRRRPQDTAPANDLLSGYAGSQVKVNAVTPGAPQRFTAVVNNYAATCDGDSGGPATRYAGGNYIAVGVHRGSTTPVCATSGATMFWSNLADKATWIQNVVAASGIGCSRTNGYMKCF
jgi:V8-like Glu-specific endopeptidase